MKGRAQLIGSIGGRATVNATTTGGAIAFGTITGTKAVALQPLRGKAERTRSTGLYHYLQVTPTEPQQLVWLVPHVGIDYQIETSTDLHWEIK